MPGTIVLSLFQMDLRVTMDNTQFIQIFTDRVLAYYPSTRFVVNNNAKDISATAVNQSLNMLNVFFANILPYFPKSNAVENLHRYLLQALRINVQQACPDPSDWFILLPMAYTQ